MEFAPVGGDCAQPAAWKPNTDRFTVPMLHWSVPSWALFLFGVVLLWLLFFYLLHRASLRENPAAKNPSRFSCRAAATWFTFLSISAITFFNTSTESLLGPGWYKVGLLAIFSGSILALVTLLEGIELAYTELRDKELQNNPVFSNIRTHESDFYNAREWCVVLLVVAATLIVEADVYRVPLLGTFSGGFARWTMTILLTTLPLVWIAQSPGKELARRNSELFLHSTLAKIAFACVVRPVRFVTRKIGLDQPSNVFTEEILLRLMPAFRVSRNLPPGERRFFTDSLKKYGYGILSSNDMVTIAHDGRCRFEFEALYYIGLETREIRRFFALDADFDGEPNVTIKAFDIVAAGEFVNDSDLEAWKGFVHSNAGEAPGPINQNFFSFRKEIAPREDNLPGQKIDIRVEFASALPRSRASGSQGKCSENSAALIWIGIQGRTHPGAFRSGAHPENPEEKDSYFKRFAVPCLQANLNFEFPDAATATFANADYSVEFDRTKHKGESNKFEALQQGFGVSDDGKKLQIVINSPLPGAQYRTTWLVRRR
jgi:hypothetical protein